MRKEGLPDETCMIYEANDWNKYLAGGAKATKCPPEGRCRNCMPLETPAKDVSQDVCWPVKKPLTYSVRAAPSRNVLGCGCSNHALLGHRDAPLLRTVMTPAPAGQIRLSCPDRKPHGAAPRSSRRTARSTAAASSL